MNLDWSNQKFRELLDQTSTLVAGLYDDLGDRKVIQANDPTRVRALFDPKLPERGTESAAMLEEVAEKVINTASLTMGPHFFAYVGSGGSQMGVLAELITAALDQNCGKWHLSPPGSELEKLVVNWISEFIGYGKQSGGVLVSGGSNANLHCLTAARCAMADWDVANEGLVGKPPMVAYVSEEGHSCLEKSLDSLGLGRKALRKVPVGDDLTIDLTLLEARIREDKARGFNPFCVIGNAGTVNTGAIDDLDAMADLCKTYKLWFHIDAAYGGPAAALPHLKDRFKGMERAHSVAVDPHKWLYIPFEAGCALIRDNEYLRQAYAVLPNYLAADRQPDRFELFEHSFALSRNFKALKVWMTFKAYGAERLRQSIADNIASIQYLAGKVEAAPDFENIALGPLSALCFRYTGGDRGLSESELEALNGAILEALEADGRVFIAGTRIEDRFCLRACLVNHRAGIPEMDHLLDVVREIAVGIRAEACV